MLLTVTSAAVIELIEQVLTSLLLNGVAVRVVTGLSH
jgi:hypothetical protein